MSHNASSIAIGALLAIVDIASNVDYESNAQSLEIYSNPSELIRTVYMEKKGEINPSFKRRYFKLYANKKLEYYTNQSAATKAAPKGIIDLRSIRNITKSSDKIFEIETNARNWMFRTEKEFIRNSWVDSILYVWKGINYETYKQKQQKSIQKYAKKNNEIVLQSEEGSNHSLFYSNQIMNEDEEEGANQTTTSNGPGFEDKFGLKTVVPSAPNGFIFHRIKPGDTLISLSVKYGVSENKMKKYNKDICFGHRLTHICGKLLLIPNGSNVVLTENMKKRIDEIYKEDQKYNLSDLDDKKYQEPPDEKGKIKLRKAFLYNSKTSDEFRADYYLKAGYWNVRRALKLWKEDDVWEQQSSKQEKEVLIEPGAASDDFEDFVVVSAPVHVSKEEEKEEKNHYICPHDMELENEDECTSFDPLELRQIITFCPTRTHLYKWRLFYSTHNDGISVNTLYQNLKNVEEFLLIINDTNDFIFGAFVDCKWKQPKTKKVEYKGSINCFVFNYICNELCIHKSSGHKQYFFRNDEKSVTIGAGEAPAIYFDYDFSVGRSVKCESFNSPSLTKNTEFKIKKLEIWAPVMHSNVD